MRYAQKVPSVELICPMCIPAVVSARQAAVDRPAWSAIFMKAFALAARDHALLRQIYMPLPWAHLYEYPHSIAVLMIEREYQGENIVLATKIRSPETQPLADITREIRRHQNEPVDQLGRYRMALLSGSLPWPLRRLQWWSTLYLSGFKRVKRFGTFGVTSVATLGVEIVPMSPATSTVCYGPIDEQGNVNVRLCFDHRVYDAGNAARAMKDMERCLNADILAELRQSASA